MARVAAKVTCRVVPAKRQPHRADANGRASEDCAGLPCWGAQRPNRFTHGVAIEHSDFEKKQAHPDEFDFDSDFEIKDSFEIDGMDEEYFDSSKMKYEDEDKKDEPEFVDF